MCMGVYGEEGMRGAKEIKKILVESNNVEEQVILYGLFLWPRILLLVIENEATSDSIWEFL